MGARSERLAPFGDELSWSLLDATPDGILISGADGSIEFVNQQAETILGYESKELLGQPIELLLPEGARGAHRGHRDRYQAHPVNRPMGVGLLLKARRKDGSELPVEISLSPLELGGQLFVVSAVRDVTQRVENEARLRRSQEALADAERIMAISDDRDRIARELHDTVIQRLFGAGLALQASLSLVSDVARPRLEGVIDDLDDTIRELRAAIFSLQGSTPGLSGLRGRLVDVSTDAGRALGFEPRIQFDGSIDSIPDEIADDLVPVLREALSNVGRHAHAKRVRVALLVDDDIRLTVTDDGVGIPSQVVGGRGLANLAKRAEDLGGTLEVGPDATGGTRLTWQVPFPHGD
jgi:PAS domain S-box-containing protein